MTRRHGFTLVETLIVVVVIGLVGLIALPKLNAAFAQSNLLSARARVISLYSTARAAAMAGNQTGVLRLNGNQVYVYARPRRKAPINAANQVDTIVRPADLSVAYGVSLAGGVDSVRVASTGLGLDAANIVLVKGSKRDTIVINQYGQVAR